MKARLLALAVLAAALAAVLASGSGEGSRVESVESRESRPPLFPYWQTEQMNGHSYTDIAHMPVPAGTAILVADGYLIGSLNDMGGIARNPGADPAVRLYVGPDFVDGRYVDVDWATGIALIRADVPANPVSLRAEASRPVTLLGILNDKANEVRVSIANAPAQPCSDDEAQEAQDSFYSRYDSTVTRFSLCFALPPQADALHGLLAVDANGNTVGLLVRPARNDPRFALGQTSADVRAYLDGYFSSWGSAVTKPSY